MDDPVDNCEERCSDLLRCGIVGVELDECIIACEATLEEDFIVSCNSCLQSESCEDVVACFEPAAECHQEPSTSFLTTISGFDESLSGAPGFGRITTYDGREIGAFAESEVNTDRVQFRFGTVLSPGLHYRLEYFIDTNNDGVCEPGTDLPYDDTIFIDEPSAVTYAIPTVSEMTTPEVCDSFVSGADLCIQKCQRFEDCDSLNSSLQDCEAACLDEDGIAFLNRCVGCLDTIECSRIDDACLQNGGSCDASHEPPDAEFLFAGSGFDDYLGLPVRAQVQDLAGQALTPILERTLDDGSFFMHFGQSVWMNQTYDFVFYIDQDESGTCSAGDPGWAIEVPVEESALHYQMHVHDPALVTDVCDRLDES